MKPRGGQKGLMHFFFPNVLFYLHSPESVAILKLPCIITSFFLGDTLFILRKSGQHVLNLDRNRRKSPRSSHKKAGGGKMKTRHVQLGCNTPLSHWAARSFFDPSVLLRRPELSGSRAPRFRTFALSLRRLVCASIHQVAFTNVRERLVPLEQQGRSGVAGCFPGAKRGRWSHTDVACGHVSREKTMR